MASISERMVEVLNRQINAEIYSAYLYLSMAAYFEFIGLKGFANWMRVQWQEELKHAMRIYDYVVERGGRVKLYAVNEPPSNWKSPLEAFEAAHNHEVKVTALINELVELALKERDFATYNMLQWFINEQIEEEASTLEVVDKLKLVGDDGKGIFMLDRELAQRQFADEGDKERK